MTWVAQLLLVPLLLHHLGRDIYGLYAALASLAGYFGLLTFGSTLTVPRYVASHAARGEREALSDFASTYLVAHIAVAAAGLLIGLLATPLLQSGLKVPEALAPLVSPAWRLILAGWALGLLAGLFQSLLTGVGDVHLASLANATRTTINLAVAALILVAGGGLTALLAGFAAAALASSAVLLVVVRRRRPDIEIRIGRARLPTLRATVRPASYYFLMQVAALAVMGTDNIVIGVFLGVGAVAAYAVAFQLWSMTLAALWTAVDPLQPFFTRWEAEGDRLKLKLAYLSAARWSTMGSALAAVVIAAFGQQIIAWWVGRELVVDQRVLLTFSGMLLIATPIHVASLALAALGRHRPAALGGAVEAVLNVALSIMLVRSLGVLGVALGTLLAGLATNAWIAPGAANRAIGVGHGEYALRVILPAGLTVGAVGAFVVLYRMV